MTGIRDRAILRHARRSGDGGVGVRPMDPEPIRGGTLIIQVSGDAGQPEMTAMR